MSESFIRKYHDKVNWKYISKCQSLSEEFIAEFKDSVNWDCISEWQVLSESFILEFKDRLDFILICKCQNIPIDTLKFIFHSYLQNYQKLNK